MLIHIHRHSEDSLLDGMGKADQYAEKAAEMGQWALGLTDHATLAGTLKHIDACRKRDIVPICGVEAYFRHDRHVRDKEVLMQYFHLVLLAKDLRGWHNLMRMVAAAYTEGFYGKPAMDWEVLEQHHEGIIATSSCIAGYVAKSVLQGDDTGAMKHVKRMQSIFGDDYYIAVHPHCFDDQVTANVEMVRLAAGYGVPLVAEVDAHYPYKEWADTHSVLWNISTATSRSEQEADRQRRAASGEDAYKFSGEKEPTLYLMSEQELRDAYARFHPHLPNSAVDEAIENTGAIASKVTPFMMDESQKVPLPKGGPSEAEKRVKEWVYEGLERIGKAGDEQYRKQVEYELGIWKDKDVFGYFYVIGELVRWAKGQGIRVGAGRGSAAGSLCLYCMRVTGVDPIAHRLIFERFMNPLRSGMPDVDVDFQHDRIDEVRDHLREVWGEDNVAQISAYQRFQPRAAVRAVSIALDVPFEEHQHATKSMADEDDGMSLAVHEERNEELRAFFEKYPEVRKHALILEGQNARMAKHPAGMVVTDKPVFEFLPVMKKADGPLLTAYSAQGDFNGVEKMGALKYDLLATDSLSIQARCQELIREVYGQDVDVDTLPHLSDPDATEPQVMELFGRKRNFGVFQFPGQMVQQLLAEMKPTKFEHLSAANAIDRPGPLTNGVATAYADAMNGRIPLPRWPDVVKPFVDYTYGFMIYQEQVMQVVAALAGISMAEADNVRKALTKWSKERADLGRKALAEIFEDVKKHAVAELGMTEDEVAYVYNEVLAFLGYSFNRAHSVGYAAQSYQDMWLKVHYPDCFHAAVMQFEKKLIGRAIREAQVFGVEVQPPNINVATEKPTVVAGAIVFPLDAVKQVGVPAVRAIVNDREEHGLYDSYEHFQQRIDSAKLRRSVNSRAQQNLLSCGAFDSLGGRDGWSDSDKRNAERELMGFVLQGGTKLIEFVNSRVHSIEDIASGNGSSFIVGGTVTRVHEIVKPKGKMAFVTIEHGTDEYEVVSFFDAWPKDKDVLREGEIVLVAGPANQNRTGVVSHHSISASALMAAEARKK